MSRDTKPVYLDAEKCNGCVSCMKRCPTEAIRVRGGKAAIMYERCVGCGECVKVCPTHAKKESCDSFLSRKNYKYTVALACPSIYGQFNNLTDLNFVLTGLKKLGFDDVFDVGYACQCVSVATAEFLRSPSAVKPVISSACPAVLNLILMRYEHLLQHLSPMKQPEEVAAEMAARQALDKTGLKRGEIGIFLITHCAANLLNKNGDSDVNCIDEFISLKEIYFPLLSEMNKLKSGDLQPLSRCDALGVSWGCSTGETMGLKTKNFIVADGIENVMTVLNDLEHEKLRGIDFLELNACTQGCVGGSMNLENPFLARTRLRLLREALPLTEPDYGGMERYRRERPYVSNDVFRLSENRQEALKKAIQAKQIYDKLPHINCGSCGAPNCMALAEDIVKGLDVKCKFMKE